MTGIGIGIGIGIGRGGGRKRSPLLKYDPVAAWDPNYGLWSPAGGATVVAGEDLTGDGYTLTQPGAVGLQPGYVLDAHGHHLVFTNAQFMIADALAAVFSGVSKPFTVVAAIRGLEHSIVRCAWSAASNTEVKVTSGHPSQTATTSRVTWVRDTIAHLDFNTVITQGVFIVRYDGVTLRARFGALTTSGARAGTLTASLFTIGAYRYSVVPSIIYKLYADWYGTAVYDRGLSDAEELERYATLSPLVEY